jgi:peptide/nickel transport system permease protein
MEGTVETTAAVSPWSMDELLAPPLTLRQLIWHRFRRHKMALFGVVVLVLLSIYSFGGMFFFTEAFANYTETGIRLQSPSADHPFGTDTIGRDILARTIYGGQISLIIGVTAALIETIVGVLVGAIAGYYGGLIDNLLMRVTEAMLSIPQLFLLIVMAKFFAGKVPNITLLGRTFSGSVVVIVGIIGLTSWMYLARIVRASFLSLKEQEYVTASRCIGTRNRSIILSHILPNTVAPITVAATLGVAGAILAEAYVSFLGLGVQPPTATWGNMLDQAYHHLDSEPWMWFFPGMFILITVLGINFVGDGLRDALDPRALAETE